MLSDFHNIISTYNFWAEVGKAMYYLKFISPISSFLGLTQQSFLFTGI